MHEAYWSGEDGVPDTVRGLLDDDRAGDGDAAARYPVAVTGRPVMGVERMPFTAAIVGWFDPVEERLAPEVYLTGSLEVDREWASGVYTGDMDRWYTREELEGLASRMDGYDLHRVSPEQLQSARDLTR